ncbi:MAG TPA: hotdog domain-containing protein [Acidimicrobiales bacterium]
MPLRTGLAGRATMTVADADTAVALKSGQVPVLATPRVVALCEEATCVAVAGALDDTETTVGMRVQLDHLAPTAVGGSVTAEATLEKVEGRRLVFTVSVSDGHGLIAAGKITRVVVETERFLKKTTDH